MDSEMKCNVSEMWSSKMPKGLYLEITHHPLTIKSVANLLIAIERLKGGQSLLDQDFVTEKLVYRVESSSLVQYSSVSEHECSVTDGKKRSLVLVPNSMELHAVMLQGGTDNCKVHLNMSTYVHPTPRAEARTVALGIKDTNFYLSCHKDGAEPTLHLEVVENKDSLSSITSDSDMVRFLFYKQDTGVNVSTLVSVPYSDWYISTAEENNRPVEMCLEDARRHRTFNIQHQN